MSLKIKFGIMQGRLSPVVKNRIQIFPVKNWKIEFQRAKKLGMRYIEWTLDYDTFNKNPLLKKRGIQKIKELSKKNSIKIKSLTGDCFMQKPFWKISKNKKLLNDFKKILNSCKKVGIKYIVVPLVDNGKIRDKKTEKNLINICKKLIKELKKKNVQILFESDFEPKRLKKFILNFDKQYFGINYDLGNSASLGYNIDDEFKNYSKYIKNIHIKDRVYNGNTVRLGNGDANFKKLFKNLKKYRYRNMLIFQTARSKIEDHVGEMKKNLKFIKKFYK